MSQLYYKENRNTYIQLLEEEREMHSKLKVFCINIQTERGIKGISMGYVNKFEITKLGSDIHVNIKIIFYSKDKKHKT